MKSSSHSAVLSVSCAIRSCRFALLGLVCALCCWPGSAPAKGGGRSSGGSKSVPVRSYTRSDGTRVSAHFRSPPGLGGGGGYSAPSYASPGAYSSGGSYSLGSSYSGGRSHSSSGELPAARAVVSAVVFQRSPAEKEAIERRTIAFHQKRAQEGSASAQYELGLRHLEGRGVEKDEAQARKWLSASAEQGNNQAYAKLKNHDFAGVERDADGQIARSSSARAEFMRLSSYPKGRPGYVVDHVVSLKRGGADSPSNMQWQTIAEARAKDKWE